MHIGIDARCIFSPRPRGTGRNLADALRLISALRPDWRFTLYHQRPADDCPLARAVAPWTEPRTPNVRTRRFELPGDRFDAWFQLGLPTAAWIDGIDLLHFPASAAPAWCPVPYVVTVHDLIPLVLRGECSARQRRRFENGVRRAVRNAVHLIVPSRSTRDDLCSTFDVTEDRASVVPWAPDTAVLAHAAEMQRTSGKEAQEAKLADLRERYGLKRPWLLNFSGDSPRKNAHRLIEAFARLPAALRNEYLLLLVGCAAQQTRADLNDLAAERGVADRCRILDFLPHEDLPALLAGAAALVMPSRYEGFGLPVLDAFALGVPVLTSRVSSLPEIAGDAAIYCDPLSPESIADGIVQVVQPETARALVCRGYERVQGYTWEQTARAMCAVYEHALGTVDQAVRENRVPQCR